MRWQQILPTINRVLEDPECNQRTRALALLYKRQLFHAAENWAKLKRKAYHEDGSINDQMMATHMEIMKPKMRAIFDHMMDEMSVVFVKYISEDEDQDVR